MRMKIGRRFVSRRPEDDTLYQSSCSQGWLNHLEKKHNISEHKNAITLPTAKYDKSGIKSEFEAVLPEVSEKVGPSQESQITGQLSPTGGTEDHTDPHDKDFLHKAVKM